VRSLGLIVRHFEAAAAILGESRPSRLLVVGGTCGVEAAPVSYLNDLYAGELAVLWFDAHADMNTPESSPSGNFHGMVLRTLLGDGPVEMVERIGRPLRPAQVFLVGARDLDPAESAFIADRGIAIYPEVSRVSGEELCGAIERAGLRRVYLHFDVDVINPEVFPDALMHAPGGPSFGELSSCLRMVTETFEIVGASVVEFRGQSEASRRLLLDMLRDAGLT
jgi:arginase